WLAIEQMCETATAHLLRGLARSERPVAAAIGLQLLSARFREPGWLVSCSMSSQPASGPVHVRTSSVQEAAAPYLVRHGVMPLAELPRRFARGFPPRTERQEPQAYWLSQALAARPCCFEAINAHALYLCRTDGCKWSPWNGWSTCRLAGWERAVAQCATMDGRRSTLETPHAERPSAVARYQQLFEGWALRPLRPGRLL
nr:DUF4034 domain-containing protein [Prescottella equi]